MIRNRYNQIPHPAQTLSSSAGITLLQTLTENSIAGVSFPIIIEPAHEIMALFILRKLILQTCMHCHPVGLDVCYSVGPFVYFHTSCMQTAKALTRLRGYAVSPEPSLVA